MIGLRDVQIANKTLFLGISMKMFLEEMHLNQHTKYRRSHSPVWEGVTQFLMVRVEQKVRGKANSLSLLKLGDLSLTALRHWLLAFRQWLNYITGFFTDSMSWDFSTSITAWTNSYNKSPLYICLYVAYCFFFSGEP